MTSDIAICSITNYGLTVDNVHILPARSAADSHALCQTYAYLT